MGDSEKERSEYNDFARQFDLHTNMKTSKGHDFHKTASTTANKSIATTKLDSRASCTRRKEHTQSDDRTKAGSEGTSDGGSQGRAKQDGSKGDSSEGYHTDDNQAIGDHVGRNHAGYDHAGDDHAEYHRSGPSSSEPKGPWSVMRQHSDARIHL
jgi:hypothetical protein